MAKKIAVLARDRQEEALRMALGIILMDDIVDVYVLDRKLEGNEEINFNIQTMKDMDMRLFSNCKENKNLEYLAIEDIAQRLLDCDHVLSY